MKKLLLLLTLCTFLGGSAALFAQDPDPRLFQTWYLYATEVDLGDTDNYFGEDVPVMTISPDLSFVASENCWEYEGDFSYESDFEPFSFGLTVSNYNSLCSGGGSTGQILHLLFEHPDPLGGDIFVVSGVETLSIEYMPGFIHTFRNEQTFSIAESTFVGVQFVMDTAGSRLLIEDPLNSIESLNIYSISGQRVQSIETSTSEIQFSDKASGVYFVECFSGTERMVKKVIKQ